MKLIYLAIARLPSPHDKAKIVTRVAQIALCTITKNRLHRMKFHETPCMTKGFAWMQRVRDTKIRRESKNIILVGLKTLLPSCL